ncbi:hypothetical protein AHF37_08945 [Paragonimus kellicotti]|nr:hypothetical protein AHF37_08945 [Paragonimus kellicotti]
MADLFLPPQNVVLKQVVLEGTFGLLYEAKLRILPDRKRFQMEQWKSVFVKTVSNQATNEQIQIFLQDACKMAGLRHKTLAPMVAASRHEHQSGSGVSTLRTASLPKISPRAKDLCNIMADLFLPPQNVVLKQVVLEGNASISVTNNV